MKLICGQCVDFADAISLEKGVESLPKAFRSESIERVRNDATQFHALREAHHERLRALFGHDGFQGLERLRVSSVEPDSRGRTMTSDEMNKNRSDQRLQKQALVSELGVEFRALEALNKRFIEELDRAPMGLPVRGGGAQNAAYFREADLPDYVVELFKNLGTTKPWPKPKPKAPDPWTVVTPPYPYEWWFYNGWKDDESYFQHYLMLNRSAGIVGQEVRFGGGEAACQVDATAAIGFRYTVPQTGRLEIVVDVELMDQPEAEHYVSFHDEWGASWGFAWGMNSICMMVEGVETEPWQTVLTSGQKVSGDAEGTWPRNLPHPDARIIVFKTQQIFPKDREVIIWLGSNSWNRTYSDDMFVMNWMKFRWSVWQIAVRVIPFP